MARMLDWLGGRTKPLKVKVTTMDADLNAISVDRDAPGQQLFDMVCKIIGLRELWYFGLCFSNRKGFTCWLQMDKEIRKQAVPKQPDGSLHFLFLVKFFPESVKAELIQDLTRHLFFLQIRQSILSMDLYCPSEAAILLASYACQALNGDQSEDIDLDLAKLIPPSVIQQYEMSAEMWDEKIRNWWANNSGLSREDAEEEFLCVAEELDMYGIQYYPIRNQLDTELLLGVSAQGLGIYEPDNKLSPRPFFPWTEIKCISFKNKMFTIYTADKSKIRFRAQDMSINQSLLDLCVGTHNLYLRRRQPDLLEVQQMRMQAREQRQRRLAEQGRLQREREQRVQAELERDKLRAELGHLAEQLNTMQSVVKSAEETHQLIAERARLSEKEAQEMARRANDAETEVQRIRFNQRRAEESKIVLERKVHDVESLAQRLIIQQQQQQRQQQQPQNGGGSVGGTLAQPPPYQEQQPARLSYSGQSSSNKHGGGGGATSPVALDDDDGDQQQNHQQQQQQPRWQQPQNIGWIGNAANDGGVGGGSSSNNSSNNNNNVEARLHTAATSVLVPKFVVKQQRSDTISKCIISSAQQQMDGSGGGDAALIGGEDAGLMISTTTTAQQSRQSIDAELQYIYAELEQSREEYNKKNCLLRDKLKIFRAEMEKMKREGTDTDNDRIFAQKMKTGCFNKHSTLRKSGAGTSKSRAQYFDELIAKQPVRTARASLPDS